MKYLLATAFLFFLVNADYAQTSYFSLTTEKLQLLKAEVVKAADYTKAADIKKVLDKRQEEDAKLLSLKTDIDKKVRAEDFQAAGALQEELKKLSETKKRKDELRTAIAKATAEENYTKASESLQELKVLEGIEEPVVEKKPVQVITPPVYTQPQATTYKKPEPEKKERQHKSFIAYSPGTYAPLGLMGGTISQKGVNFVLSVRLSSNQFVYLDDAVLENGKIDDTENTWHYTDYAYYSYASYNLGMSFRMFGDINNVSGHFMPTIGISRYRYIYEYDKGSGYTSTANVLDKDQSGYNLTIAPTFLVNFKFFNVHIGGEIGIPKISQSNFIFGAGFAF
jgi:hypothetical protein